MSPRDEQFANVYGEERVAAQRKFYEAREKSFERAHRQLSSISALVFGATATAALVAGLDVPGKVVFAIIAAVLPAVSTALTAYDGLYAFERVAKLYRDAARNLRRLDRPGGKVTADSLARYVTEAEHVFNSERGQWGQLVVDSAPVGDQKSETG